MDFTNKTLAPIALLICTIVVVGVQWLSTGVNGDTDSVLHFQIAKFAFKYPALFLDHWGKPLFTILSAPMAQFGYAGAVVFNLICGLLSAWFAYLIAKQMNYKHAWVAIVFTVFTPGYLFIMYSSLTEILFSLVLIASIYLFGKRRFIWSAVLISFIPFARTEGVMFIILFIPALLCMKQYKSLPFLLTGFVIFSLAGLPVYHDLFWFYTRMPYSLDTVDIYGQGSFWYYFIEMRYILYYPLLMLILAGLIIIFINLRKGLENLREMQHVLLYLLIIPSFFGFILAHCLIWWQGIGILASPRFIACVLPLGAIFATSGFEWVLEILKTGKLRHTVMGTLMILVVVYVPFSFHKLPVKTGKNFVVMEQLVSWLKASVYSKNKAYYTDPMFPFYMDIDPFDQQKCFKVYTYQDIDPASLMKPGDLLIWDAQFAGYEGHLPFDSLMKNNNLRLLNIFTPADSFTIIGGAKYKLAVFTKAPRDTSAAVYMQFYLNDFEGSLPETQMKFVSTEKQSSGKRSILLTPLNTYCPSAEARLQSLPGAGAISLRATARVLNPSLSEKGQIILVLSIEDPDHKVYRYIGVKDTEMVYKPGEWFDITLTDVVDRNVPANGNYKVYVWYTGKEKVFVDDLKLEYMPVGFE